jgi:hypothetical protein
MATIKPIDCRKNLVLMPRITFAIARIKAGPAYKAPLTQPSCSHDDPPGLISRTFIFRDGTKSGRAVVVTCHAKVMVGFLRALRKAPGLSVTASSTSKFSGSYRTWAQQNELYQDYKNGNGHKAADPCHGFHRRGRALDILNASPKENAAMASVRVDGLKFYHGDVFGDPPHWTLGTLG